MEHDWETLGPLEMGCWYYKCKKCGASESSRGPTFGYCYGSKEAREEARQKIAQIYAFLKYNIANGKAIPVRCIMYKLHNGNHDMIRIWNWRYGGYLLKEGGHASIHPYIKDQSIGHFQAYWNSGMHPDFLELLYKNIFTNKD